MSTNRICHFKLVLLGDSAVGKSCLVVRFVRDEFFEFQEPTIGGFIMAKLNFHLLICICICSCFSYSDSAIRRRHSEI